MSKFSTKPHNRVKYEFYHAQRGLFELKGFDKPLGWENDLKDFKSSKEYAGIFNKFSTNLTFPKGAHDWLLDTYETYGYDTKIYLRKYIYHPKKSEIVKSYESILDGWTWKKDGGRVGRKVKIKAEGSDLISKIKARQNEKIDITRETTLDGTPLPPLKKHKVLLTGKRIFLKTRFETDTINNSIQLRKSTAHDYNKGVMTAFPLKLKDRSHANAQSPLENTVLDDNSVSRNGNGANGIMFFAVSDKDRTLDITINISFQLDIIEVRRLNSFKISALLNRYQNDTDYVYKDNVDVLYETTSQSDDGNTINLSFSGKVDVLKGESLGFITSIYFDGNTYSQPSRLNVDFNNISGFIQVNENSVDKPSFSYCLLPHYAINRMLQIITNRTDQVLLSDLMGLKELGYKTDGEAAYLGISIGWWIRQFNEKGFTTSFKDMISSYKVVEFCDFGVVFERGKEMLTIEEATFFNRSESIIDLPNQIQKENRDLAVDYAYSSLKIGYEKGGANYEQSMGLTEPMGQHDYIFPVTRENKLVLISKYESDPTRIEFLRRVSIFIAPDLDTRDDDTIMFLDMKNTGKEHLELRVWQDDYDTEPKGVFSPETYHNYRLLPKQLFYKHQRRFTSGFYKQGGTITLSSFIGKAEDVELVKNGVVMKEAADVEVSTLTRPLYGVKKISFTHDVDYLISEKIEGHTVLDGRKIPNIYFQASIINEFGEKELIRLRDITPKNGKFSNALTVK